MMFFFVKAKETFVIKFILGSIWFLLHIYIYN